MLTADRVLDSFESCLIRHAGDIDRMVWLRRASEDSVSAPRARRAQPT